LLLALNRLDCELYLLLSLPGWAAAAVGLLLLINCSAEAHRLASCLDLRPSYTPAKDVSWFFAPDWTYCLPESLGAG